MEMERINENTIRVLVDSNDLEERGIKILDLLSDHKQIQDFFYSILKEVDSTHQFQDNDSVTFQVMPTGNGLELFISKNDQITGADSEQTDAIADYIRRSIAQKRSEKSRTDESEQSFEDTDEYASPANGAEPLTKLIVVKFAQFDDLIQYAKIADDYNVVSELYKYERQYYLTLQYLVTDENTDEEIKNQIALAYEYGEPTNIASDYLAEHSKKLMEISALHLIQHYFS
ncbi:adaptor protein MecA [Limosilactobacillus fastidiosus]|uniref:Adapter protein MecA n=1 Tax=Limosilactobacillus fastidiosus TaxID=2759855 RepID=A0A7W3YBL4_9LACO|nr:adaptor protein MecA [Limosilactobacillus fastidiosus]MBB1062379.1 adaptor protein MecA [Limosilactobacillus fastidiosus]MBB1085290.1 adaptor protein MecA [Limosilactobacillus fastidiosus]MCD7083454.1 adaptor protein MecA [Limosilactobacillus fastidiosus]MCD7085274.1 adaptor protein MecA [Limosilactobacillus fastidiosus]MCD7115217.1 adaptor protein MecA [Limosilactobacillus fastidiosus]